MPVSCGRRLSAPPIQLKALPQLRAVIQWAMHAQSNKTVDIRDIRDFSLALAGFVVSAAGFVVSYASSDFRMKRLAVKKFMARYEPAMSPNEVVGRKVVDDIKDRLQSWRQKSDATIVSGRYKSGKTVAVQEALRGVRGVWGFTVEVEDWKPVLYQELGVKDSNMFREVLRRVRAKLQKKKYANNLTQYPILLLDIPRSAKGGLCALVDWEAVFASSSPEIWTWSPPRRRTCRVIRATMHRHTSLRIIVSPWKQFCLVVESGLSLS